MKRNLIAVALLMGILPGASMAQDADPADPVIKEQERLKKQVETLNALVGAQTTLVATQIANSVATSTKDETTRVLPRFHGRFGKG